MTVGICVFLPVFVSVLVIVFPVFACTPGLCVGSFFKLLSFSPFRVIMLCHSAGSMDDPTCDYVSVSTSEQLSLCCDGMITVCMSLLACIPTLLVFLLFRISALVCFSEVSFL